MDELTQSDEAEIRELLLFHSVSKVGDDKLVLDDGTELTIHPNWGCGGCAAGNYDIDELNGCENVITNVTVESTDTQTDPYDVDTVYSIFVYAENKQINLLAVSGTDGNGYYGTGYRISVSRPVSA